MESAGLACGTVNYEEVKRRELEARHHAAFLAWLGASAAMVSVFIGVGLMLAAVVLVWRVLAG